jgi:hypothetical protein
MTDVYFLFLTFANPSAYTRCVPRDDSYRFIAYFNFFIFLSGVVLYSVVCRCL